MQDQSTTDRFWAKVNKDGPVPENRPDLGPCWIWTGWSNPKGYGRFSIYERRIFAYKFAYELVFGPVPNGLTLDHLCRNRPCVNASHLEPVTNEVNIMRGSSFGAVNAAKTHCPRGHPYDFFNTGVRNDGSRYCLPCNRERHRREYERITGRRV